MMPAGLFDWQTGLEQLDHSGHSLVKLNQIVNWEQFGQTLEMVRDKEPKSNAERKPFNVRLMFQIMILDFWHNLSDDQLEFQIRIAFLFCVFSVWVLTIRCLMLRPSDFSDNNWSRQDWSKNFFRSWTIFGLKTVFLPRKDKLFIVAVPKQTHTRDENKSIQNGDVPKELAWEAERPERHRCRLDEEEWPKSFRRSESSWHWC